MLLLVGWMRGGAFPSSLLAVWRSPHSQQPSRRFILFWMKSPPQHLTLPPCWLSLVLSLSLSIALSLSLSILSHTSFFLILSLSHNVSLAMSRPILWSNAKITIHHYSSSNNNNNSKVLLKSFNYHRLQSLHGSVQVFWAKARCASPPKMQSVQFSSNSLQILNPPFSRVGRILAEMASA